MSSLSFTSTLSVAADILLVIFILIFSPVTETVQKFGGFTQVLQHDAIQPGLFIGLGVLSTAMACQHSAFIISDSLDQLTRRRWGIVTGCSIFMATSLCAALGTAGYLGFMEETQGDVLNNFEADSLVANAARALLAFTMFFTVSGLFFQRDVWKFFIYFTMAHCFIVIFVCFVSLLFLKKYPMEAFVARHVLFSLLDGKNDLDCGEDDTHTSPGSIVCGVCNRRHLMTFAIYIATLVPALLVDDLGPVLSITGAIGASSISYIAPGLIYLGINGEAFVSYCHKFFKNVNGNSNSDHIELPMVGDSSRKISQNDRAENTGTTPELPVAGEMRTICSLQYEVGIKPW